MRWPQNKTFVSWGLLTSCCAIPQAWGIPLRENDDKQAREKKGENLGSISYPDSQKPPHTPPARDLPIVFGNWMKPEKCPSPTQEEGKFFAWRVRPFLPFSILVS